MRPWPAGVRRRLAMAGRLLTVVLGTAALGPLRAAPLTDPAPLPQATDVPPAGSALERTLQVDTDAAQRNPDLLLETRGDGEPLLPPIPRRPTTLSPDAAAPAGAGRLGEGPQRPPSDAADEDRAKRSHLIGKATEILREHRPWLLGGLGVVVGLSVVAAVARLWKRRRAGTSERRLRALAERHQAPRRRRSSRH